MAWLYQRAECKRWWIGYRVNGKQVLKSTRTRDKSEAEKQLAKLNLLMGAQESGVLSLDLYQTITGKVLPLAPLKTALDDWLREARGATSPRTAEKYAALAKDMEAHFHATERGPLAADITREHLLEYLNIKRETTSAANANNIRKCLAVFFRRCKVNNLIRDNPMEGLKPFKQSLEERRIRRPFTTAEVSLLYRTAPDEFWRYMVLAGFFTGLRLGDLATMPVGAIDLKRGIINLLTRKTGATLHIPIAAPLRQCLVNRLEQRHEAAPAEPLWSEQAKRYEETGAGWFGQRFYDLLLVKAGLASTRPHRSEGQAKSGRRKVSEISFHCFRHAYVTTLASLGQNQQVVKALAGHSSDEINDLYTKVPLEALKQAVALLPDVTQEGGK